MDFFSPSCLGGAVFLSKKNETEPTKAIRNPNAARVGRHPTAVIIHPIRGIKNSCPPPTPDEPIEIANPRFSLKFWAMVALAIGKVGSYLLQLELSALIAEGRGEDIASPRIITANQTEAVIESGVQIPFQEASSSGATSVSFQDAVLSLRVTPQITPDDRIIMDLQVNQDTVSGTTVLGVPAINTRSVTTQVLVANGETVVLGGVYTSSDRKTVDRIPFFGDLPYVGFLFKRTDIDKTKDELLIFITPKILKDSLKLK